MTLFAEALGFFHWIGIGHYLNLLLVGFMARSGLQILSAHPKLYWRDDCSPGSEWLRFSRKKMPAGQLWTSADEETSFPSVLALPGGKNLGMGRHWHFFCAIFWMLNGVVYVVLLLCTGEWRRIVPTSWSVLSEAARDAWTYLHLRAPPRQTQITKHHCIQGWSAVGEWTGVAVADVLDRCRPLASARYLVFRGFDESDGREYYETIDLDLARHPQTILAYEMNGATLPIPHGAPCRLRVETQLGFKMVKYLRSIELVDDYRRIGDGQGGFREDTQFYGSEAGI